MIESVDEEMIAEHPIVIRGEALLMRLFEQNTPAHLAAYLNHLRLDYRTGSEDDPDFRFPGCEPFKLQITWFTSAVAVLAYGADSGMIPERRVSVVRDGLEYFCTRGFNERDRTTLEHVIRMDRLLDYAANGLALSAGPPSIWPRLTVQLPSAFATESGMKPSGFQSVGLIRSKVMQSVA